MSEETPLNVSATAMHTDAERRELERELSDAAMLQIYTHLLRRIPLTLTNLRENLDSLRKQWRRAPEGSAEEKELGAEIEMYMRAIEIYSDEMILFTRELRNELAETLLAEFPDRKSSKALGEELRRGKVRPQYHKDF